MMVCKRISQRSVFCPVDVHTVQHLPVCLFYLLQQIYYLRSPQERQVLSRLPDVAFREGGYVMIILV